MKQAIVFLLLCSHVLVAQTDLDKQAHRGGRGLMPENTIPAMLKSLDLGVQTLEMDVVISKDKKVVVSHDTYMSSDFMRRPDGTDISPAEAKQILLYGLTYNEIAKFDAGTKPHPQFSQQKKFKTYKPLLSALIDSVDAYVKQKGLKQPLYNIEIKSAPEGDGKEHPAPEEFVDLVIEICKSKNLRNRLTIQSFDVRPLKVIHQKYPEVILSYLTANTKSLDENLALLGFTPKVYSPYYKTVTSESVKNCHDKGMQVVPWTVNTKDEITKLTQMGVDGIISDYPDLF